MSEKLREGLSAAMDGEADAFELRRVLDETSTNDELRDEWHRLHLLRDVLRGEAANDGQELRERLRAQMASDEAFEDDDTPAVTLQAVSTQPRQANWLGRLTGTAVAAAVAAVVILNADLFTPGSQTEIASSAQVLDQAEVVPVMYQQATDQDRLRMDARRMEHYQQNALNRAGAVSFVRMMTFKKTPGAAAAQQPLQTRQPANTQPSVPADKE